MMHISQLKILADKMGINFESNASLLESYNDVYSLEHEAWKDVLQRDWKGLGINDLEKDELISIRDERNNLMKLTREALLESIDRVFDEEKEVELYSVYSDERQIKYYNDKFIKVLKISLENRRQLKLDDLVDKIYERAKGFKRISQAYNLIAQYFPDEFKFELNKDIDSIEEISKKVEEAPFLQNSLNLIPHAKAIIYTIMIEKYKNLVNEGKKQFLPNLADVMRKIGYAFYFYDINDLDESMNNYNEAIKIYQDLIKEGQSQLLSDLALTFMNRGNAFDEKHDLDEAINNYNEAIKISQVLIDAGYNYFLPYLADFMKERGNAFHQKNDLDEAINNYNEVINIYQDLIDKGNNQFLPNLADAMMKRGNVFHDKSDLDKAISNWKSARDIYQELVDKGEFYYKSDIEDIDKLLRGASQY